MTRLSLAILGTAAILASALAGPAMAKGAKDHQAKCVGSNCQIKGSGTLAKDQRHMQRHAAYRGERFRNTNAALTSERSDQWNRGAAAPGVVAGNTPASNLFDTEQKTKAARLIEPPFLKAQRRPSRGSVSATVAPALYKPDRHRRTCAPNSALPSRRRRHAGARRRRQVVPAMAARDCRRVRITGIRHGLPGNF